MCPPRHLSLRSFSFNLTNSELRLRFVFVKDETKYPSQFVVALLLLIALVISKMVWFIRFHGRENIPAADGRGLLIASNHQTYVDPVWICIPMRRKFRFMAFDKAFDWPFVGSLIKYLGAFPVKHPVDTGRNVIKESLRSLSEGASLIVFPEGAREFADGKLLDFKSGAIRVAMKAGVPILPVSIRRGNEIWPHGRKYPRLFRRVEITYHPLIKLDQTKDADEWTAYLKDVIGASGTNIPSITGTV